MSLPLVVLWLVAGMAAVAAIGFAGGPWAIGGFVFGGVWMLLYGLHVTRPAS